MSVIARWLKGLGLDKYVGVFEENEIDFDALPELTEADFREMAIPIGPRRKLLKGIRELSSPQEAIAPDGEVVSAALTASPIALASGEAERRQLTVMFSDLVGSTELSQELDPEDLRELNRAYQVAVTAAIERFDGYVARYMGDGVLAYFGFPAAHENDAERAVRAALEIVETVPGLDTAVMLAVRVGIATGPVVVGDIIGDGAAQENAVVGRTPNLAARLEGFAGPNRVVISHVTHRLVEGRFHVESLGHPQLKGIDDCGEVFAVLGAPDGVRMETRRADVRTPLFGRTEEIEMLQRRWRLAGDGEGQVVLLSGNPGMGKSRVCQAFCDGIDFQTSEIVDLNCSSFGVNQAFHPVIAYLKHVLLRAGSAKEQMERLKNWLGECAEPLEVSLPLLGHLLSIPTPDFPPLDMTPKVQKAATISLLVQRFSQPVEHGPRLIVVEDAQWMDPSTGELIDAVSEACASSSVLVLVVHRPELVLPWRGRGHVTSLSLNRLGRRDVTNLVHSVAGLRNLTAEIVAMIAEKGDGTPLFIEEITKSLLETDLLHESDRGYGLHRSLNAMAIPSTLQDSLMARLDQMGAAKEIAQIAAVFGRAFTCDVLSRLTDMERSTLDAGLGQLVDADLLSRKGTGTGASYAFRQALLQDAAYASLLISRRRMLHEKAVALLEQAPLEQQSQHHQLLAYHYENCGRWLEAFSNLCLAAEEQSADFAVQEAARLYEQALRIGEQEPDSVSNEHRTTTLLHAAELMFTRGRFADAIDIATRMCTLAVEVDDHGAHATALLSMANASMWLEDFDAAHAYAAKAKVVAERADIVEPLAGAAMLRGYMFGLSGSREKAQVELDRSISIAQQSDDHTYLAPAYFMASCLKNWSGEFDAAIDIADRGQEAAKSQKQIAPYVRCLWARGTARIAKGEFDSGASDLREGLQIAQKMEDSAFIPRYLNTLGWMYNECHSYETAIEHCQSAVEFDRENEHATGVERTVFSQLNWADALLSLGDLQGAKEMLDTVYSVASNPQTHEWMRWRYSTHVFASLAQYWVAAGDPHRAREWAARCMAIAEEKDSWKYIAKARRLSGMIAIHAKDWAGANRLLLDAATIAKRIGHANELWRVHSELEILKQAQGDASAGFEHRKMARAILVESKQSINDRALAREFGTSGSVHLLLNG